MFTLLSGPFHPNLESALVQQVQQIKAADPRAPLAIIVPSESLRRRLQWVLCAEHFCTLFDVHFLTFHQLALYLQAERQAVNPPDDTVPSLALVGDFFYEYLLSVLLEQGGHDTGPFAERKGSSGLRQALWRTIRDLREGQVEPNIALQALQEGLFDPIVGNRLRGVLSLHAALHTWSHQLGVGLPDDLANSVLPWVADSPFIARLSEVLYYGFYDITQVQLSLLEEVARAGTVTVYFPLVDEPAYRFAHRFMDRYLLKGGVVHRAVQAEDVPLSMRKTTDAIPTVHVVNAFGAQGELIYTCKAIRHLVETTGYAFYDVGVVARNLEPYLSDLRRIFDDHRIPFSTTATRPLLEEPLAKVWWQLAGLKEEQFPWYSLLDVVLSPWYQGLSGKGVASDEYGHFWVQAVRHLRIVRSQEDWDRLMVAAFDPELLQEWKRKSGLPLEVASVVLQTLANTVASLISACQSLPECGSIGQLTQAFESLVNTHVSWLGESKTGHPDGLDDERRLNLAEAFDQALTLLRQLDRVEVEVTWAQWRDLFQRALGTIQIPIPGQTQLGVQILDAMAARGRAFRTLFLLGMNDHVFPRVVREDALLRDRDRTVLGESLGYKIDEKMNGFDEEVLLFALLKQSARARLYLLYQRADHNGRPLLPSSLLREYLMDAGSVSSAETKLPLRLVERHTVPYFSPSGETVQENRLRSLLQKKAIQPDSSEVSPWWEIFQNGMESLRYLERTAINAGPFDGMMPENRSHWQELGARGLSPTALEEYAQCPMRYWMKYVLSTKDVREPISRELPSRVLGELVHALLLRVYQGLAEQGWPQQEVDSTDISLLVISLIEQVSQEYAVRYGKGYVVFWDWMIERLSGVMIAMIDHDYKEYVEHGFVPVGYEVEAEGDLPGWPVGSSSLVKIRGRWDRVDQRSQGSESRIVDYKFSASRRTPLEQPDLLSEAIQGRRLQPPLYSLMFPVNAVGERNNMVSPNPTIHSVEFRYMRPMQDEPIGFASFSGATWETAMGEPLLRTLHRWVQGIRAGQFFMLPGHYCRDCQWSVACRFQHHPSWARAYGLPLAREFRQLRKQRVIHE
ncbi:MAG: PD-(D/E)XK nuclease family protein [Nitrospirales bacterium]